jgi:plastocyanin
MTRLDQETLDQRVEGRERLAIAAGVALLVAGIVLIAAVLPAEYGVDPLGTGRRLGLMALSEAAVKAAAFSTGASATTIVAPQDREYRHETIELEIQPGDFVEYKYRLDKGQALLYAWKATSRVDYELHAEPDGAPAGYAESYEKKDARDHAFGTLTVPFAGIHGWYWENKTGREVTVTLSTAGFYTMAHEFRAGQPPSTKIFQ